MKPWGRPLLGVATVLVVGCANAQINSSANTPNTSAEKTTESKRPFDYVVGISSAYSPSYSGSPGQDWDTRPVIGLRWGRIRISSSSAGRIMGFGTDAVGSGASAELLSTDQIRLRLSLRTDHGRRASSDPELAGLPDVRATARVRLGASYAVTPAWSVQAAWGQDILDRGGGALADLGVSWAHWLTPTTEMSAGASLGWADARYLRSYYGVPAGSTSRFAPYSPGSGFYSARLSLGATTAITRRWVVFTSLGYSQLLGNAAASPLTRKDSGVGLSIGLAYRCCASFD